MFQSPKLPGSLSFPSVINVAPPVPPAAPAAAAPIPVPGSSPASQGTVWTIDRLAREFAAWAEARSLPVSANENQPGRREFIELGLACLVFSKPRECWEMLEAGCLDKLIVDAENIVWEMPIDQQLEMQRHFNTELARIHALKLQADQA